MYVVLQLETKKKDILWMDDHVLAMRISSHGISKTLYIRYDMKTSKMIVWSLWDCLPSVLEEIDSSNEI